MGRIAHRRLDRAGLGRLASVLLLSVLLGALAPALSASALAPAADGSKLSGGMANLLRQAAPTDPIEALIRFGPVIAGPTEQPADGHAVALVEASGGTVIHRYESLPVLWVRAPASTIQALSLHPWVTYVERNARGTIDMDVSTTVINATKAWATILSDAGGPIEGGIDGSGVTVAVVDTGIDADHPDLDYGRKTVSNVYLASPGSDRWVETSNSDLYYGHGTHVAGTVAGNGEASAGARRGVAPGASLAGVTLWDPTAGDYLTALEWVFTNSRPGANPLNIRVATNSWHTVEEAYDNESALSQIIMRLTYENNVLTTWSAGNEGRTDPEGGTITTSKEGNTPIALEVAAYEHDGSAVTDFSSRGKVGMLETYPDIGAPGRSIWSTSARRTLISSGTYSGGNSNPYYLAISGTSMSTPHVAGLAALLWQAAPSLRVAELHEDCACNETPEWYTNPYTRIHEIEWIVESTAHHLPVSADTGVPTQDNSTGHEGLPLDYAQGYGIVDAHRAIGLALTLERLRTANPAREVTVLDALAVYERVLRENSTPFATDTLVTSWQGEYSRYDDGDGFSVTSVNQTKVVFVPNGTTSMEVTMSYVPYDLGQLSAGDITFTIDTDGDGSADHTGPLDLRNGGTKVETIQVSGADGSPWTFDTIGSGFKLPRLPWPDRNYVEWRVEYTISLRLTLDAAAGTQLNATHAGYGAIIAVLRPAPPSPAYGGGSVELTTSWYLLDQALLPPLMDQRRTEGTPFPMLVILLAALAVGAAALVLDQRKRRRRLAAARAAVAPLSG